MDIPSPPDPTPDAKLEMVVNITEEVAELPPGDEDSLELEVGQRAKEQNITRQAVHLYQGTRFPDHDPHSEMVLNELGFQLEETTLTPEEVFQLQRIIVAACREYNVPAREENVFVSAYVQVTVGGGP